MELESWVVDGGGSLFRLFHLEQTQTFLDSRLVLSCLFSHHSHFHGCDFGKCFHDQVAQREECCLGQLRDAKKGHLEVVMWLKENGCKWDEVSCYGAAKQGHLETLKWMIEHGCPVNKAVFPEGAAGGQLEVLELLLEKGCPFGEGACASATSGGHLEVLK